MHIQGTLCQASQCAPQDHLEAGFFKQVYESLSHMCTVRRGKFKVCLPCVTGRVANITRAQRVCTLCQTGSLGDGKHLVLGAQHCRELEIDLMAYLGSCRHNGSMHVAT